MTKLRRLDPQPADLTTHKGPFTIGNHAPARLICHDRRSSKGLALIWLYVSDNRNECAITTNKQGVCETGVHAIFAVEEIREPIVEFHVYEDGFRHSIYTSEGSAIHAASMLEGTVRRMVQDTSYGGGV